MRISTIFYNLGVEKAFLTRTQKSKIHKWKDWQVQLRNFFFLFGTAKNTRSQNNKTNDKKQADKQQKKENKMTNWKEIFTSEVTKKCYFFKNDSSSLWIEPAPECGSS